MPFSIGDSVRIKYSTLTGIITNASLDDAGNYYFRVAYDDVNGEAQERPFLPDQLEAN